MVVLVISDMVLRPFRIHESGTTPKTRNSTTEHTELIVTVVVFCARTWFRLRRAINEDIAKHKRK